MSLHSWLLKVVHCGAFRALCCGYLNISIIPSRWPNTVSCSPPLCGLLSSILRNFSVCFKWPPPPPFWTKFWCNSPFPLLQTGGTAIQECVHYAVCSSWRAVTVCGVWLIMYSIHLLQPLVHRASNHEKRLPGVKVRAVSISGKP